MGVIANLSLRFALHTLFADSERFRWGIFATDIPRWESIQWPTIFIVLAALIAILKFELGSMKTMLVSCLLGLAAYGCFY